MSQTPPVESEFTMGSLYTLLKGKFPDYRTLNGRLDVPRLAARLSMSHEGVYKWLRTNRLTPDNAKRLVELANEGRRPLEGRAWASLKEFHPFVF